MWGNISENRLTTKHEFNKFFKKDELAMALLDIVILKLEPRYQRNNERNYPHFPRSTF
jgi:hypothetical protein